MFENLKIVIGEQFEKWNWGEKIFEGNWLEDSEIYSQFIDQMQSPWITIRFRNDRFEPSLMDRQFVSASTHSSKVSEVIEERLKLFGCNENFRKINFVVTARAKNTYKSLRLLNMKPINGGYFLYIRISDKPKLLF